jgi:hypothetical protein
MAGLAPGHALGNAEARVAGTRPSCRNGSWCCASACSLIFQEASLSPRLTAGQNAFGLSINGMALQKRT